MIAKKDHLFKTFETAQHADKDVTRLAMQQVVGALLRGGTPPESDQRAVRHLRMDARVEIPPSLSLATAAAVYTACRRVLSDNGVSGHARALAGDFSQTIAESYARRTYLPKNGTEEEWMDSMRLAHKDLASLDALWKDAQVVIGGTKAGA